jgi:hypothetical protein
LFERIRTLAKRYGGSLIEFNKHDATDRSVADSVRVDSTIVVCDLLSVEMTFVIHSAVDRSTTRQFVSSRSIGTVFFM